MACGGRFLKESDGVLSAASILGVGPIIHGHGVQLKDQILIRKLISTDMVAMEAKYHKPCYRSFLSRVRSLRRSCEQHQIPNLQQIVYGPVITELVIATTEHDVNRMRLKKRFLSFIPKLRADRSGREVILSFKNDVGDAITDACAFNDFSDDAGIATTGVTDSCLKSAHVKRSGYAHEVTLAALHCLKMQAIRESQDISESEWDSEPKDLPERHPDVHSKFCSGHFTSSRTGALFSAVADDHYHEQNNKIVNGNGGATEILDNETPLLKWMVADPITSRLMGEFEDNLFSREKQIQTLLEHYENTKAFDDRFRRRVDQLIAVPNDQAMDEYDTILTIRCYNEENKILVILPSEDLQISDVSDNSDSDDEANEKEFETECTKRQEKGIVVHDCKIHRKKPMPLKQFRAEVSESLLYVGKTKRGKISRKKSEQPIKDPVVPRPSDMVRKNTVGHLPVYITKGRTSIFRNDLLIGVGWKLSEILDSGGISIIRAIGTFIALCNTIGFTGVEKIITARSSILQADVDLWYPHLRQVSVTRYSPHRVSPVSPQLRGVTR
ncbi:hypothetical protein ILUMI_13948 [Ignelater luminosus]|uniref:Uncharacterized protein n=1 Tax=Ignelater luminosus TaxID=2038154 RepID=A0A8K0CVT2_IGNLU|nr:hypothetical protein ILUMI_13948 [Ignelater luminosus]